LAEEKIRIVLDGLRGEESIAKIYWREGIAASMYYGWSKEVLEAGKKRLAVTQRGRRLLRKLRRCAERPCLSKRLWPISHLRTACLKKA
jgi:transposase-like protein